MPDRFPIIAGTRALTVPMTHTCPACGKQWECNCEDAVKQMHVRECGSHDAEIACSLHCAEHLAALVFFLARRLR